MHLKIDGWFRGSGFLLGFFQRPFFQGRFAVSFGEGTIQSPNPGKEGSVHLETLKSEKKHGNFSSLFFCIAFLVTNSESTKNTTKIHEDICCHQKIAYDHYLSYQAWQMTMTLIKMMELPMFLVIQNESYVYMFTYMCLLIEM